ncbi:uncharacterized protein SCHCODRAFT_02753475 [Schizophyllum commune H4-8]|uniref:uncharacterized protein n=1 Tax=Schizophyllum commune (strain H4-8 / FGSC 9210) TaxID=578458 RepID=UPI00215FE30F|nr:uncharacterized protein SCHCODRAFT_02753475 [Schizophyllum commune H4-8]KAI5885586.1 hypothetical protein SCHCODRAFT_02753475 [Schizophyllum commune H4-8]
MYPHPSIACPALPTSAASFKEANGTTSSKISSGTQGSTNCAFARKTAPSRFDRQSTSTTRSRRLRSRAAYRCQADLPSTAQDRKMHIRTSTAPRPARESLAERRDFNGVGKGARERRRREAPSHVPKRILEALCARLQMQNFCILTQNAPRAARESLAERRELSNAREGARTRRRRRGAPPSTLCVKL